MPLLMTVTSAVYIDDIQLAQAQQLTEIFEAVNGIYFLMLIMLSVIFVLTIKKWRS